MQLQVRTAPGAAWTLGSEAKDRVTPASTTSLLPPPPSPVQPNLTGECLFQHPPLPLAGHSILTEPRLHEELCNSFPTGLEVHSQFLSSWPGCQLSWVCVTGGTTEVSFSSPRAQRQEGGTLHFHSLPSLCWAEQHLLSPLSNTAQRGQGEAWGCVL